jgi:hypothetical protein
MKQTLCIVSASLMQERSPDRRGNFPIYLTSVAGRIPNRNVLAGTVAQNSGFEPGSSYLAQVTEIEEDVQHGRQFSWLCVSKVTPMEVIDMQAKLGAGSMFDVAKDGKAAQPKTVAAELIEEMTD